MSRRCVVYRLGLVAYEQAWKLQNQLAENIAAGEHLPTMLLLEHPHTYTFGRRGQAEHLLWDEAELARRGVEILWVDRGGDVTYHGPGQLVGYPLLPLAPGGLQAKPAEEGPGSSRPHLPQADYVGYVRKLEEALILALMRLGVTSEQVSGLTGVWVQPQALLHSPGSGPGRRQSPAKVVAIGIKVDVKGVSRHGFALNVNPDMSFWEGIVACGLEGYPLTSLAELQDPLPSMPKVMEEVIAAFGEVFDYEMIEGPYPADIQQAPKRDNP